MASFFNITTELTQELIAVGANVTVSKISLTNIHDDTPCTVDLYIEKKLTGKFYLIKKTLLPVGATLIYDEIAFSTKSNEFGLFIKLNKSASETPTVDVIIN